MDLSALAEEVGTTDPVTIEGAGTRGGAVPGVRAVRAPAGIEWIQPDEMTLSCGAATPVDEVDAALAEHGQVIAVPPSGTIGGALAVGRSGLRRLGYGPVRDVLLQTRYVSATGEVVTAGGPTVKNVSGFDLCRLLVGSRGTLGFLGDVILRTRPRPAFEQWYHLVTDRFADPAEILSPLHRPDAVLWNGSEFWVLLAGAPSDVAATATALALSPVAGPPELSGRHRWSVPPASLASLSGDFVAEVGVGVVHHRAPAPPRPVDPGLAALTARVKMNFDPSGRLNPGTSVLAVGP
ncbi:MAG: FAD-binding protein [Actinomycetota bacterium]|nr:FAD-binding protein [Actinomycetota bacterium]